MTKLKEQYRHDLFKALNDGFKKISSSADDIFDVHDFARLEIAWLNYYENLTPKQKKECAIFEFERNHNFELQSLEDGKIVFIFRTPTREYAVGEKSITIKIFGEEDFDFKEKKFKEKRLEELNIARLKREEEERIAAAEREEAEEEYDAEEAEERRRIREENPDYDY